LPKVVSFNLSAGQSITFSNFYIRNQEDCEEWNEEESPIENSLANSNDDILLYNPSNLLVASVSLLYSSLEMIRYTATTTGRYFVIVIYRSTNGAEDPSENDLPVVGTLSIFGNIVVVPNC